MEDITKDELQGRLENNDTPFLIDVREPYEHEEFNIGGENLPLGDIMEWSDALEVPADREIVVYCKSGNRSGMAKSVLTSKGFSAVRNLLGGMTAWQENS